MNLNKVILIGRISQQINSFNSKSGLTYVRFNLAITRDSYGPNKSDISDFIPIVAFGNNATFISKFFNKGDLVNIVGSIQMSQYTTKNGDIASSATIVVDQIKSLEPLNVVQARAEKNAEQTNNISLNDSNNNDMPSFYQENNQNALSTNEDNKQLENSNEDNPWELDL